jgi:hypothetical protein
MATLPDHERAIIPHGKLRYALDPNHEAGRDKARVFKSALGLDADDLPVLERMLRDGISTHDARLRFTFVDGTERWVVEWIVLGRLGPLRLMSAWNRCPRAPGPELVSCYLKKVKQ